MTWHTVAEGIAQARREKGVRERRDIPQEEIAGAVGVTVAAYSRWENGQRVPRESDVRLLAEFFGVSPAYLRYGIEAPPERPPVPEMPLDGFTQMPREEERAAAKKRKRKGA